MKKALSLLMVVMMALPVLALVPGAGAQEPLGSEGNPIEVYFVPSGEAQVIVEGGEVLAQALKDLTGYTFKVLVPTSYAATIEAMCAAPDKTLGFIPAAGYIIANNRCGVEVAAAAFAMAGLSTGRSTWCAAMPPSTRWATWPARPGATAIPARPPATSRRQWN